MEMVAYNVKDKDSMKYNSRKAALAESRVADQRF